MVGLASMSEGNTNVTTGTIDCAGEWHRVCVDFYSKGINKSAMEWFQQLDGSLLNNTAELSTEDIDFYKKCGIFTFASQDEWYKFDRIKNNARSIVHTAMSRHRQAAVVSEIHRHSAGHGTESPSNSSIMSDLNQFLGMPEVLTVPVLWTVLDHVCLWISSQLKWNVAFLMTLESVLLTEMSPSLLTPLVALLGSLGSFKSCQEGGRVEEKTEVHTAGVRTTVTTLATGVNDPSNEAAEKLPSARENTADVTSLSWVLKPHHADAFLQRIRRKVVSFRPRDRPPCQQSSLVTIKETNVPRSNVDGGSEISFCFLL